MRYGALSSRIPCALAAVSRLATVLALCASVRVHAGAGLLPMAG